MNCPLRTVWHSWLTISGTVCQGLGASACIFRSPISNRRETSFLRSKRNSTEARDKPTTVSWCASSSEGRASDSRNWNCLKRKSPRRNPKMNGWSMVVLGSPKRWDRWHFWSPNWQYIPLIYCLLGGYMLPTTLYRNLKNPLSWCHVPIHGNP